MTCDYVVIGAGAAGCVVAARLSEDPACRVTLLEAGGDDGHLALRIPAFALIASTLPQHNWYFETEPVPALNERRLRWSQGKGLGGSSSINGMIFMRGHSAEYDRWARDGCPGWAYDDVLPYYRKAERNARGASALHGGNGPVPVRPANLRLPVCEAFLGAAAEAGIPRVADINDELVEGFGYHDVNIERGRRMSMAVAYLDPALKRKNLTVLRNAPARRILIENGRATGVEYGAGRSVATIRAEREVILCASSVNSPQLLMLSGIGPAGHLREHGIAVEVDAPEVGQNLQNHAAYRLRYSCSQPVTAFSYLNPARAATAIAQYAFAGTGPLGESFVPAGGIFRSDPAQPESDMIVVAAPVLTRRGGLNARLADMLPSEHGMTIGAIFGRPQSRGQIRLRSADPGEAPAIFPNYFAEPSDMRRMVNGVQRLREVMRQPSIRAMIKAEEQPGAAAVDDRTLEDDVRAKVETSYHPNGTCRMGSDEGAVVDPQLRVRHVAGLRVADISVIPTALCACTHGPAIMIGEKAADLIKRAT